MGRTLRTQRPRAARGSAAARGFTLIEATLAVTIVAFGFLATMELFAACTVQNQRSAQLTIAQMLCTNVQELTTGLPFKDPYYATATFGPEAGESQLTFNDVDDFDGFTVTPPYDSTRSQIAELKQYTQVVTVTPIDPNRPGHNTDEANLEIPKRNSAGQANYTGAVRVRVTILYKRAPTDPGTEVMKTSWVRVDD
jgi:type II secretory pathway pseudopilin PulG